MTILHLAQTADLQPLDDLGVVGLPLSEPACTLKGRKIDIAGRPQASTGIWECSPGSFRRQVTAAEVMHILSGECEFIPDEGKPIHIKAGDSIFMPPDTNGVWKIYRTVRKIYTLL